MTLTYIELEHAHAVEVLLGVVDRRGQHSRMICSAHGEYLAPGRGRKTFFAASDYMIALTPDHQDARRGHYLGPSLSEPHIN